MNPLGDKGQIGPLGEDMVSITVSVFLLAVILTTLNYSFTNRIKDSMEFDMYERGRILAEVAASRWSYESPPGTHHMRLMDVNRLCMDCPDPGNYRAAYRVKDLSSGRELCSCGPPLNESRVITMPVAVRVNQSRTHPAVIEVMIQG